MPLSPANNPTLGTPCVYATACARATALADCVCVAKASHETDDDSERAGVNGGTGLKGVSKSGTISGISTDAEYRRTIGALFALYWLMRIGIDGERGFSFGVDDRWRPREVPVLAASRNDANAAWESLEGVTENKSEAARRAELVKRLAFYERQVHPSSTVLGEYPIVSQAIPLSIPWPSPSLDETRLSPSASAPSHHPVALIRIGAGSCSC